eukprot:1709739-Pleurochrysis_carterae.AAC.1
MAHVAVPVSAAYKGPSKKDKKAIAAAAFGRKGGNSQGGAPRSRAPYKLPNGQWCSKGTCHFTHDTVSPGGPCYRDPRRPGPLPDKVIKNKQQVERIKNARENIAKRLQVANLPISSAIPTGPAEDQIIDFNGIGVYFTLVNAVDAADGDQIDDQGEHTNPSLDFKAMANTNAPAGADSTAQPTSPHARAAARNGEDPP